MVTSEDIGKLVKYWNNGNRVGTLEKIFGNTAYIQHSVLKKKQKALVIDCTPIEGVKIKMPKITFEILFDAAKSVGFKKQEIDQTDQEYLTSLVRAIST